MNAVFRVPPSFLAAALVSSSGLRRVSSRRFSDRLRPDRGVGRLDVAELADHALDRPGEGDARGRDLGRVGEEVPVLAADADGHAQAAGQDVAHRLHGRRRWCAARPPRRARAPVAWAGSSASRVRSMNCIDSRRLALAVGDGVVQLLDDGALAVLQPVDDVRTAHRGRVRSKGSAAIRVARSQQLAQRPGAGEGDVADVVVEVELRVVDPRGGVRLTGVGCTRWRSRGTTRLARSMRRRKRSKSTGRRGP